MKCIIPLAGPDIYSEDTGFKPSWEYQGEPLISKVIQSRPWWGKQLYENDLVFIIRSMPRAAELRELLSSAFLSSRIVEIPDTTRGAVLSVLAGISVIKDYDEPIIVDLADIFFNCDIDINNIFLNQRNITGVIPFFESDNSKYSYLKINDHGEVLRTVEKSVISKFASAGVYIFRKMSCFLSATSYSVDNRTKVSHNNMLYLCPSFNGIIGKNQVVKALKVTDIVDIALEIRSK